MKKTIVIITIITLLVLATGTYLYFKLRYECGDKVCELHELTTCRGDCKEECNQTYLNQLDITLSERQLRKLIRQECSINWDDTYTASRIEQKIPDDYVLRTKNFDYDDLTLQEIIVDLNSQHFPSTEKIVDEIGDYVYFNIEYKSNLSYSDCLFNLASDVNKRQFGLCSTMSKVDIALLRGLGIAARPVIGCVKFAEDYDCVPLRFQEGVPQSSLGALFARKPKVEPIEIDEEGIAATGGGLHTWMEVWLPERGWVILEPTTGYLVDKNCLSYKQLKTDPDMFEFCGLSQSQYGDFIDECRSF